jgi:hypothetical protein
VPTASVNLGQAIGHSKTLHQGLNLFAIHQPEKKLRASIRQRPAAGFVANQVQRGEAMERFEADVVHRARFASKSNNRVAKFVVCGCH